MYEDMIELGTLDEVLQMSANLKFFPLLSGFIMNINKHACSLGQGLDYELTILASKSRRIR